MNSSIKKSVRKYREIRKLLVLKDKLLGNTLKQAFYFYTV